MTAYDAAFEKTLAHEGGYVDDPDDPGGATNYGVSLRWLRAEGIDIDGDGDVDADDIAAIDTEDAKAIYHEHWWLKYRYDEVTVPEIAAKIFDLSVNMGPVQAHKLVQKACNTCGHALVVDGILGSRSIATVNSSYAVQLLDAIREHAADFYTTLVEERPELAKYLNGWLRRAAT